MHKRSQSSPDWADMVQREPTAAAVEGTLPSWLHGSLVRNGPGTFRGMKHLFDGYAMLVKVHFEAGQASVQQRCVTPHHSSVHAYYCMAAVYPVEVCFKTGPCVLYWSAPARPLTVQTCSLAGRLSSPD